MSEVVAPTPKGLDEPWRHNPRDVLEALASGHDGLSDAEARRRLAELGPNELSREAGARGLEIVLRQFRSPLIYILLIAGGVSLAVGEALDAAVIAFVLALNAVVGFAQEYRAEHALEALRQLVGTSTTRVAREGRERDVDTREIVVGDVVLLEAGRRVPADARVLHASALEADESLLTGESGAVAKRAERLDGAVSVADRANMLFTGSVLTRGRCRGVVTAVSGATELGSIAGLLREIGDIATPLQQRMARFARLIGAAVLIVAVFGFLAGLARGEPATELFLSVVALAVSAIPEGLPIVLTVALAISVRRMAAVHAVVRRLPAVESLGSCTVIGSDKTGTLTQNRMTVERIVAGDNEYRISGGGAHPLDGSIEIDGAQIDLAEHPALERTLLTGALCSEASVAESDGELDAVGDPTEVALLVAAAKAGLHRDDLEESYPRVADVPFEPERRYAATLHEAGGRMLVLVKGSPEQVLAMSTAGEGTELDRDAVLSRAEEMAADGLRVLAMAGRETEHPSNGDIELALEGLTFFGLQGMMDPPRVEAREAVANCRAAGIRVVMITGDHAITALAIAGQLGIGGREQRAVTGAELDRLDADALDGLVDEVAVYARVAPEQKLRLVEALRRRGEIVAVTGDGVNDAPALKAADIGAAMGSGTDVAKESADIVVLDDSFATIFGAVREGRIAFDNVRKTTFYLVSSGVAEVLAVLVSLMTAVPLPFLPAQLLWLNVVTNGVQDVALAFEPGEPGVTRRPPRPPREGIISRMLWERIAIAGAVMAAGTLALFLAYPHTGDDLARARTIALTTMVVFQVMHVGNARSEHRSAFARSPFSNPLLLVGTALALGLHVGALYFGPTQEVLRLQPLDLTTWASIVAVSLSIVVAMELHKVLRRPRTE